MTAAALWAATSLAKHPTNSTALREAGTINALLGLLSGSGMSFSPQDQEELSIQAAAALAAMASSSEANQEAIVDAGGLRALERLLRQGLGRVGGVSQSSVAGLRAFTALLGGKLSRGAAKCTERLRGDHANLLVGLLEAGLAGAPDVAEEACRALEGMTAASPSLCSLVCNCDGAVAGLVAAVRQGPYAPGDKGRRHLPPPRSVHLHLLSHSYIRLLLSISSFLLLFPACAFSSLGALSPLVIYIPTLFPHWLRYSIF